MSNKAIFLDCDGTIIEDPGYINHPDQVKLLEGVAEALRDLRAMGYKLVIVSNQSAVARGIVTEKILGDIHNRLRQLLAEKGAFLDKIYYCPYHPEGVIPKYRKESDWRKPNPGMLLAAASEMDIDLSQSWMIGNSSQDVQAGIRAGCKTILMEGPLHHKQLEPGQAKADYKAVNIKEAVNIVKSILRSSASGLRSRYGGVGTAKDEQYHRTGGTAASDDRRQTTDDGRLSSELYPPSSVPEPAIPDVSQDEKTMFVEQPYQLEAEQMNIDSALRPADKYRQTSTESAVSVEPEEQAEPSEPQAPKSQKEQETPVNRTEQLLASILDRLKSMQRTDMFGEFSITRLLAGIIQVLVLFCLLLTIWFLMSPSRQDNAIFITLGFAMVLQMMSLTFYMMQGRR